jgi:hypothetical protein
VAFASALALSAQQAAQARYAQPVLVATLDNPRITESSGLVASPRNPGIFWTHNDSGDGPFIYAFDRKGAARGTWRVRGAQAIDWEDMAAGPGPVPGRSYLYLADFGDNGRRRREVVVYRVPEPEIASPDSGPSDTPPQVTGPADAIRLRYGAGVPHNGEALLVHPITGDLYVVTKLAEGADPETLVFRAPAPLGAGGPITLRRVASLSLPDIEQKFLFFSVPRPAEVTGGDISPDGRSVILATYGSGFELTLPDGAAFHEIWRQQPVPVDLGERRGGESVCYRRDGLAILAGSEGRNSPVYEIIRTEH